MAKKKEAHIDEQMASAADLSADEVVDPGNENPAAAEGGDASVEPVQLQINDLQGLGAIINLACERGAYKAAEMQAIGTAYNKLNAFLGYVAANTAQPDADADVATQTAQTTETE